MRNLALLSIALCVSNGLAGVKAVPKKWKSEIFGKLEDGGALLLAGVRNRNVKYLSRAGREYEKAFLSVLHWYGCDPQQGARLTLLGSLRHAVDGHALARRSFRSLIPGVEGGPCSLDMNPGDFDLSGAKIEDFFNMDQS